MKFSDRIAYKYYDFEVPLLVIYNFASGGTYYYESVSAEILYSLLENDVHKVTQIRRLYEIDDNIYESFMEECQVLLNTGNIEQKNWEYLDAQKIDDSDMISEIQKELFEKNILYRFHIDITGKCNFRCKHCYHPFENYEEDELDILKIEQLFEKLNKLGVFVVTISGGEPFLRKDIFDIISLGEKYGFVFQILTNGYLIDEEMIKKISQHNICKLSFSYYGNDEQHTYITGNQKARMRLMETIELCKKYNVKYELKFILLQLNVNGFDEYVDLCKKEKIKVLFEPCLIPQLDGNKQNFDVKLDYDTYKEFMRKHLKFFYDGMDLTEEMDTPINCSAGKYGLYCDFLGNIYPCVSYREYLGKFTDIYEIWNSSSKLKELRSRKYKQFKSFNKYSFCKYCYQICPGLSLCENNDSLECYTSGCLVAKVIESVKNEIH